MIRTASTLRVESTLGEGSTFWFEVTFPVAKTTPEERSIGAIEGQNIVGYKGPKRKILVVDDKTYNRLLLVSLLEPLGFEVFTAGDGREEVEKAREIQPDLILTDLVMPLMTGIEAAQEIRQIPTLQSVPIIAVSASVLSKEQQKSRLARCDDYLSKPINADRLFDMLKAHLALEWVYETDPEYQKPASDREAEPHMPDMALPPAEELEHLFDLARRGSMRKIHRRAEQIETMDEKYKPFARKLQQLAKNFEDQIIKTLLKQYLRGEP